ncbi:MAG TPA: hypothetical protein VHE55_06850 [Fimbriimonadaceae bacterium]|nr:hypothetical protein [Fimbriimonadaceae bacterium]
MSRWVRFALAALMSLFLFGCRTSEIKNQVAVGGQTIGLQDDVPAGSVQSGYGDGKGDSVGGGGASPALNIENHDAKTEDSK